jgi:hypothetical protein
MPATRKDEASTSDAAKYPNLDELSKPLRLRRRRDGTMALTDASGSMAKPGEFPERHLFVWSWLAQAGAGIATVEEAKITLRLANARAEYDVVGRESYGVVATLCDAEFFPPPPIDEERAAQLQSERRVRVVAEYVEEYGVDEATAEQIAVDHAVVPPSPRDETPEG